MNIEEALNSCKNQLLNEPLVQEFFRLRSLIENNDELVHLQKEISLHQKKMSENMNNDEIYLSEKTLYEKYSKEYFNNPLVQNFMLVKEETRFLLEEIKEILQ